ncbi:MAG: hypothetical protein ACRD2W_11280 [Acidimicrobiales bacterium]
MWVPARYPAVYVLAGWRETWHQRLVSAVLAAPGEPLASHRAAAVLHGLREGAPIELIAPLRKRPMKSARLHGNTSMRAIARR